MKLRKLFNYAWLLLLIALPLFSHAQVTVSVNCTGTAGSYKSGSVNSSGALVDGDFAPLLSGNVRGFAVFSLASAGIPAGSAITAVSLTFNKSAVGGSGSFTGNIKAVNSDLSILAAANQGPTVYTTVNAGTSVNTAAWSNSTGSKTLNLTTAGVTFIQNNFTNTVSMCWSITASARQFTITGYGGVAADQPKLTITYLPPCTGAPVAGTANSSSLSICPSSSFNLSLTGATSAAGISYQWQSSPAGLNTWTNISGATSSSYTYSAGITVATDFRAYVSCSNTSLGDTTTNPVSVAVAGSGLPEDFSSSNFPPCGWAFGTGSSFVLQDPVTSAYGLGVGSAYFDFYSLDPGSESSPNADLITVTFPAVTAGFILSFDEAYATYTGGEIDNLQIQTSTNGGTNYSTLTTFTGGTTGTLNTGGSTSSQFVPTAAQWATKQVILPAGVNRIRFRGVSGFGNELYLDNVKLLPPPACIFPSSLAANNITTASANLTWANLGTATQFRVEYGPLGFTPGTGTFALATTTSYALSTLSPATAYSFYVRSLCSATDSSTQTGPFNFTTPCMATNVPYIENFDGVTAPSVPSCLTIQDANTDGTTWHTNDYNYTSGPNAMTYSFNASNAGNDWFFTPGINMTAGTTYIVSFKYASDGFLAEKLEVKNGSSPTASAMGAALFSNTNILNDLFNTASFFFTPSVTGVQYFGWRCFSVADQDELYVDDISITLAPTCLDPTALTITNMTTTAATLAWTNNSPATQFRIEYGPAGFTPGTGTFVLATSNPFTINGLTLSTSYSYYVRALCSATDSSAQVGPYSFATPCVATSVPYSENFDGASAPAVPSCVGVQDVNADTYTWFTTTGTTASAPNSMAYQYNSSSAADDWFFTRGLNLTSGSTYIITFKYAVASSSYPENLEIKVGSSPVAAGMTGTALFSQSSLVNTSFATASFFYTPSATGVFYFGWHCFSPADQDVLYVDDISIDLGPTCAAPTGLASSTITPGSADITWTNNSSATQFRIEYGPTGFTPGTGTFAFATGSPYNISGLNPATAYDFYVRALCSATDSSTQSGPASFTTLITNDLPAGAFTLTVGAGCAGLPYTNAGATNTTGEPFPSCRGTAGFHSVWYKFVAPSSGFVRVTNDYTGATIGNSRIGVFSTTDPNSFSAFTILGCDDNNASTATNKSLVYVNGLTPAATYYVEVDGTTNGQAQGTFCLTVDEVNSTMLSTTAACAAGHNQANKNTSYLGWISLVDASGKIIANVRQSNSATTSPTAYASAVNINTAAVRQNNGLYYLDRNYMISATGTNATQSFDVQFYFLNTELTALQGVDASATASALNVTRQANNTCQANFATANGARTILTQTGNTSANGVTGIQVVSPGFSNFYIHAGIVPLNVKLESISGVNVGTRNRVDWSTASEEKGDVFVVQRSIDGRNFTDIGTVNGNGKASSYSFWDERPVAGVNHYRLRLTDAAGASSFSNIVDVNVVASNTFTVEAFPNPAKDMVTVKLYGTPGANPQVILTDVTGKHVMITEITGESTTIDIHNLVPGFYLIKYSDGTNSQVIKLNKE